MWRKKLRVPLFGLAMLVAPSAVADPGVELTDGADASASGGASYIVRTPAATYY